MTKEEEYLKNFDLDKEWEEFGKRYNNSEFLMLDELKEKFLNIVMSTFFMDRIHKDFKEYYEKYNKEYKPVLEQRDELLKFINDLKYIWKMKTNIENYGDYIQVLQIFPENLRPFSYTVNENSFVKKVLLENVTPESLKKPVVNEIEKLKKELIIDSKLEDYKQYKKEQVLDNWINKFENQKVSKKEKAFEALSQLYKWELIYNKDLNKYQLKDNTTNVCFDIEKPTYDLFSEVLYYD